MNKSIIFSIILGFLCVAVSIKVSGDLSNFYDPASIFIVVGGVVCAVCASYPFSRIKSLLKAIRVTMKYQPYDLSADIDTIIEFANIARRYGLLALDDSIDSIEDPFLKKGLMLAVDVADTELITSILDTELSITKERHAANRAILDSAAAYSPAFGMIGTLIGLINMLTKLQNMESIGMNMAVALVTTFYGSMLANLVFSPISKHMKAIGENEYLHKELIIEGIIAIKNGENPRIIREKLNAYLSNSTQVNKTKVGVFSSSNESSQETGERKIPMA